MSQVLPIEVWLKRTLEIANHIYQLKLKEADIDYVVAKDLYEQNYSPRMAAKEFVTYYV